MCHPPQLFFFFREEGIELELELPDKGVAVALNNELVPREEWGVHVVKDGDEIVILKAFCGG